MVHTSGSTGFPKPMFITHEFLAKTLRNFAITAPEGYITQTSLIEKKRCVCFLPLGHPAGITFSLLLPLSTKSSIILPLPNIPPTGDALVEILLHTQHAHWAALAPLTLETISKTPSLLSTLASYLEILVFSGGSLPKLSGDEIARRTGLKLLSFLGSSETGPLQALYRDGYDFASDWNYLQFPPELGAQFERRPGPGTDNGDSLYELVFERSARTEPYQAVFASYPSLDVFQTSDLFTPHPVISGLWTHASRSDDVIVFSNGEKVNPVDFESRVSRNPDVAVVLMFGERRFEAGLLVELVEQQQKDLSVADRARVIKTLWPVIEEANKILPAYAHVEETHVVFTEPGRPVLRTLKGTVRRKATIELYREAIDRVYADFETMGTALSAGKRQEPGSEDEVQPLVREALRETTGLGGIAIADDFFNCGMDSLQVLRLVRHLRASTALNLAPSLVYLNPSIRALSTALYQVARDGQISEQQKRESQIKLRGEILQKYLDAIDAIGSFSNKSTSASQEEDEGKVIILTGSTGTIGSYILSVLLKRADIAHIYCFNRSADSENLQKNRNAQQDPTLPLTFPVSKVTFRTIDLTDPTFGPEDVVYTALRTKTTHVIHNAWKVDFNLPLQAFETQLDGVVNLVRLCAHAPRTPSITFISSVSAAMNFCSTTVSLSNHSSTQSTAIPERILTDLESPAPAGYAESKYIAERLLARASEVPALILGSRGLGAIPDTLSSNKLEGDSECEGVNERTIDWVPIDGIAEVIVEVGLDYHDPEPASGSDSGGSVNVSVFHPLNPHRSTWASLLPSIISALESYSRGPEEKRVIEVVSPVGWLSSLRDAATRSFSGAGDREEGLPKGVNPALRLLDFFFERFGGSKPGPESLKWETGNAERASQALRETEEINAELIRRWVRQWLEERN
ncbi:hypothetical protein BJY01DRAFT_246453 [Aspergillus pseudoustus]|uniref:Carrier domain-containing protein n=1 Tax=Aspergillus pseudoustus TaxID=1810923 RepID=A0ABR4K9X3_9EURO